MSFARVFGLAAAVAAFSLGPVPSASAAETTDLTLGPGAAGAPAGDWAKADGAVRRVVAQFRQHMEKGAPETFEPGNPTLLHSHGRLTVDIVAVGDATELMKDLKRIGMNDAVRYGNTISGSLPIGAISRAVGLRNLRAISAARLPMTQAMGDGLVGEGDEAMLADTVQASGITGEGVMIGVMSDSFDQQGGYAGTPPEDLPPGILVLDDTANCGDPCSDEGRAMMELIHDVAPGADLAFHSAFVGGKAGFASGIDALVAAGADIVVDDVIVFTESMFQDDVIARAADNAAAAGVAYFSSAGNFERRSFEAAFQPSNEHWEVITGFSTEDRGPMHDFGPKNSMRFTLPNYGSGLGVVTLVLQWDQPWGAAESDLDIGIGDTVLQNVYASSFDVNDINQGGNGLPLEVLQFGVGDSCDFLVTIIYGIGCVPDPGNFELLISLKSGLPPALMKFVLFEHNITWEFPTYSSTLIGHANAAGAMAVGAGFWQSTPPWCDKTKPPFSAYDACGEVFDAGNNALWTAQLEYFSAAGGTPILFDTAGNRLTDLDPSFDPYTQDRFMKPEVVGPDGTNTTFFGGDTGRDADTLPNFFGTSAGAPHVAAVGALMLQADPDLTPVGMYSALKSTALNMLAERTRFDEPANTVPPQDQGFDFDTGWGFVQADLAVAAVGGDLGNSAPTAVISVSCTDLECSFDGSGSTDSDGTLDSYAWDFGDGNVASVVAPTHTYAEGGDFTVTLTVTDNARGTGEATETVSVVAPNEPPVASFTFDCTDLECSFDASGSSDSDGTITAYAWDFGDDTTGTGATASHTFPAGGTWTVTLTVTDDADATGASSRDVDVEAPNVGPTASFTFDCTELTCTFDAAGSSDSDGTLVAYAWTFGDGAVRSGISPTHAYASDGTYTVVLTVEDDDGATGSTERDVTVSGGTQPNALPTAAFTASCTGLTCSFNASTSSDSDGTIASYDWDFGDTATGSGVTTSHTYANGTWTVTLTVTDNEGGSDGATRSVTANAPPTAAFTVSCTDLNCSFDASGSSDDVGISSYAWDFGDGTNGLGATISHGYSEGTWTAILTVTDGNGASASTSKTVTVTAPAPTAASIHVGNLSGSSVNQGKTWDAMVSVVVHDSLEAVVNGATVTFEGGESCTTAGGSCTVTRAGLLKKDGTTTFTVASVSGGLDYQPADNEQSSITVSK